MNCIYLKNFISNDIIDTGVIYIADTLELLSSQLTTLNLVIWKYFSFFITLNLP